MCDFVMIHITIRIIRKSQVSLWIYFSFKDMPQIFNLFFLILSSYFLFCSFVDLTPQIRSANKCTVRLKLNAFVMQSLSWTLNLLEDWTFWIYAEMKEILEASPCQKKCEKDNLKMAASWFDRSSEKGEIYYLVESVEVQQLKMWIEIVTCYRK